MATAKLVWERSGFPVGSDIISGYGGFARALTKTIGVVSESEQYPAVPFLFSAPHHGEAAAYWGELLYPGAVYISIPGGEWSDSALPNLPSASMDLVSPPQRGLLSVEWDRLDLELMRLGSLGQNWDGEGADAVSTASVRSAQTLLRFAREAYARAQPPQSSLPYLFASIDGGIAFKWNIGARELKCVAVGEMVELIRWSSSDQFESDGYWEIPASKAAEHFEWLLR